MNRTARALVLAALSVTACTTSGVTPSRGGSSPPTGGSQTSSPAPSGGEARAPSRPRAEPPAPGARRDVHLPTVRRTTLPNGLEVNVVALPSALPTVHLRLVVRGGTSGDPAAQPGLSAFLGRMLKEGVRGRTSAQLAEENDFLGGTLDVQVGADATTLSIAVLRENLERALTLLSDLASSPTFPGEELERLRRRELDELQIRQRDPGWPARRAFYRAVYGSDHPYGRYDTTEDVLRRLSREDLVSLHRARFVAGGMYLVVAGDVDAAALDALAPRTVGRLRRGTPPVVRFPAPPALTGRQVFLVDRPGSQQSVVRVGVTTLPRSDESYVPLAVANHVLGGGAASRLFLDLRELRSLTYGAYSRLSESVEVGSWFASGQVRTPATGDALHALVQHVECLASDAAPDPELNQTRSYLIDSFPLSIETPGDVADLVSSLRLFRLPDDYFDTYRQRVSQVDAATARAAAERYLHPDRMAIVVVGAAEAPVEVGPLCAGLASQGANTSTLADRISLCARAARSEGGAGRTTQPLQTVLQGFGAVRVLDLAGNVVRELPATERSPSPVPTACGEINAPALQHAPEAGVQSR